MNLFDSALKHLKLAGKVIKLDESSLKLLSLPQRTIELNLPLKKDTGEIEFFKGYRVQYNNLLGPYKGGLRFHPRVSMSEVKTLAFWMMIKNAISNIPFGGGKGGIEIDPKNLSEKELENLTRKFTSMLSPNIGPYLDVPAPDVNTNSKIMDWVADEYEKNVKSQNANVKNNELRAVVTGKSLANGGSEGREEATGLGGFVVLEQLVKKLKLKKSFDDAQDRSLTVAVQGFGNVGSNIAKILYQNGYSVVAVSDVKGAIYDAKHTGFNVDLVRKCKEERGRLAGCYCIGSVCDLARKYDEGIISNEELLELEVDILIPAALENVIHKDNANKIKAKIVFEMANGPTTPDADKILNEKGILVVPDVLANCGGVTVSYFEWYQNINGEKWSKEKVNGKLREKMVEAFDRVWKISKKKKVSLRTASYIVALQRLSKKTNL